MHPFFYPLKTSENRKVEKGWIGNEWVKNDEYFKLSLGLFATSEFIPLDLLF